MALGAKPSQVLGIVVFQGMMMTGAGLVAGIAGALMVTHLVTSMLVNVSATDPMIFIVAALFLALVALLAS